jgi:RNA-directed DNA polymerase
MHRINGADWAHIRTRAEDRQQLSAQLQSYWGHFSHAQSVLLRRNLWRQYPWMDLMFDLSANGELHPSWVLQGVYGAQQIQWLRERFPAAIGFYETGNEWMCIPIGNVHVIKTTQVSSVGGCAMRSRSQAYVVATKTGRLKHGLSRREVHEWFVEIKLSPDQC